MDQPLRILVAGSIRDNEDEGNIERFRDTCRSLGQAIAEAGARLIIGSTDAGTADSYALEGFSSSNDESIALLVHPEGRDAPTDLGLESEQVSRPQWRRRQVHRADAVLFVGGWRGTRAVYDQCLVRARPHVAVPFFGGQGKDIFEAQLAAFERQASPLEAALDDARDDASKLFGLLLRMTTERQLVAFERKDFEPHVLAALRAAETSGGISADETLRAIASADGASGAFLRFQEILARARVEAPPPSGGGTGARTSLLAPFAESLRIAMTVGRRGVWGRTIVTAALHDPEADNLGWMAGARDRIRREWSEFLLTADRDYSDAWEEAIFQFEDRRTRPLPADAFAAPLELGGSPTGAGAIAGVTNDAVPKSVDWQDDRLEIGPEANALAAVIAAESVAPPLSIALFGDWGLGKSFFMKTMRSRIEALCTDSASRPSRTESVFLRDIAHVEFNAWHYMDTNLWASLVSRIFAGLASHIRKSGDPESTVDELFGKLSIHREEEAALRTQAGGLQKELQDSMGRRDKILAALRGKRDERAKLEHGAILASEFAHQLASDAELRALLIEAGLLDEGASDQALVECLDGFTEARREAASEMRLLLRMATTSRTRRLLALSFAFLLVGILVIALCLPNDSTIETLVRDFLNAIAIVGTILGSAGVVLRRFSTVSKSVRAVVARSEEAIEQRSDVHQQGRAEIDEAIADLERSVGELEKEQASLRERRQSIEKKLKDLHSGQALLEFVEERITNAAYKDQLGIISTIRQDFERLSDELAAQRAANRSRRLGEPLGSSGLNRIERIVLYVDDLDRCTPKRVVEVMQAVHLLLAFPLFVVVVAVDSRWLLRSLEMEFSDFLGVKDPDGSVARVTTPSNYLEKIFQVTYTLSPLQRQGYLQLLDGLVPPPPAANGGTNGSGFGKSRSSPRLASSAPSNGRSERIAPASPTPIDPKPPELEITEHEVRVMDGLDSFFETPRAVKRFVNTYRILKVVYPGELARPDHQDVALLLLAALTGFPAAAPALLNRIENTEESDWAAFAKAQRKDPELEELVEHINGLFDSLPMQTARRWSPRLRRWAPKPISLRASEILRRSKSEPTRRTNGSEIEAGGASA